MVISALMSKEYDLVNELGPKNWLDVVAGRAVVEGHRMNLPELVAVGTNLAKMIKEVRYNDDSFGRVIACGLDLERRIEEEKYEYERIDFLDDLYIGTENNMSSIDWEYQLIYARKRFCIIMMMPEYYGSCPGRDITKERADRCIRGVFEDSSFETYQKVESREINGDQEFTKITYYDHKGREILKVVDYNHEGEIKRGRVETYYFDDKSQAEKAWMGVKNAFISGQKK